MAASDRRPFSWIFAEEEAIILYSANVNRKKLKSIAKLL